MLIHYNSHLSEELRLFMFYKRNKKLVPHALLSHISTWEFLRTLEKCRKAQAALHFSHVLKNSRVLM